MAGFANCYQVPPCSQRESAQAGANEVDPGRGVEPRRCHPRVRHTASHAICLRQGP